MDTASHAAPSTTLVPTGDLTAEPPWGPRFRRAIVVLGASVAIHVWLVPTSRENVPSSLPAVAATQVAQSGTAPGIQSRPATRTRPVQVRTQFLNVRSALPNEPPVREPVQPPRAVGTSGFVSARADHVPSPIAPTTHPNLASAPPSLPANEGGRASTGEIAVVALGDTDGAPPISTRDTVAHARMEDAAIARPAIVPDHAAELRKQEEIVRRVLVDYTRAYERLDVKAAKAIWPTLKERELQQAFGQLDSQQVRFASCGVSVRGQDANARCRGDATYTPKIGSRVVHLTELEWTFSLARTNDQWRIVQAKLQ
jgi:hypothetical protein